MIDIHNHILPGVDDGSDSFEFSRKMLVEAINEGITDVCITPHFINHGEYRIRKKELLSLFESFKQMNADLNINLYLGNELYIDKDLDTLLNNNEICTLNDSRYVLLEFPFHKYERDFDEYLYNISLNYKIIIAHPERYAYVQKDPDFVDRWLNEGYILQSNSTSLFNKPSRNAVFSLIEKGKLSIIASDAHNEYRPLSLIEAYNLISRKFNEDVAMKLFQSNPLSIINNEKTEKLSPIRKRIF